jgi:hypothetical protein
VSDTEALEKLEEELLELANALDREADETHGGLADGLVIAARRIRDLVRPTVSPYTMHLTTEHGTGAWTVYRREADPWPMPGPGEFVGLHAECVRWMEEHSSR